VQWPEYPRLVRLHSTVILARAAVALYIHILLSVAMDSPGLLFQDLRIAGISDGAWVRPTALRIDVLSNGYVPSHIIDGMWCRLPMILLCYAPSAFLFAAHPDRSL